jgi:hypothetical protein
MIYLCGDTHGTHDSAKVSPRLWPEGQGLTRDDFLIVLGDFGVWRDYDFDADGFVARWEACPWTTLFIDGNHENFDVLEALPTECRWGGEVGVDPRCPHVVHLRRGNVYDLPLGEGEPDAEKPGEAPAPATVGASAEAPEPTPAPAPATMRVFVMGGADSIDKAWRTEGENWWPQEMPSAQDYARAEANLEAANWQVDYVLTHDVPLRYKTRALGWDARLGFRDPGRDALVEFLNDVDVRLDADRLRLWYAGHYHRDAALDPPANKHVVLFDQIVPLGALPTE